MVLLVPSWAVGKLGVGVGGWVAGWSAGWVAGWLAGWLGAHPYMSCAASRSLWRIISADKCV